MTNLKYFYLVMQDMLWKVNKKMFCNCMRFSLYKIASYRHQITCHILSLPLHSISKEVFIHIEQSQRASVNEDCLYYVWTFVLVFTFV
jgi:predicted restriction endonuclease